MKVTFTGSLPLTSDWLPANGFLLSWRRGDVVQPLDFFSGAGWFANVPPFREVYRSYTRIPLPFVTMRIGHWGWYFGAKGFGVDSDSYKNFLATPDVYVGSQAIMLFSFRMTRAL